MTEIAEDVVRAALERHRTLFNARRRHEWLENFVPEPFLEEPVGSGLRHGRQHYAETIDALIAGEIPAVINEPELIVINGNRAAIHFTTSVSIDGVDSVSHMIEEFEVAADGRIAGIRAFVDAEALAPLG